MAIQFIVFHAGNAQFPHLLVLSNGCLWKPASANKEGPEG